MVREMIGGCCVCLDERGWNENPLVYCDGSGCTIAVHQACYGIVQVPSGPWFCCKCKSQERVARVKCELCPQKDGALKRTDSGGWAHVVCALYIPEVRFGDVGTMEPIIFCSVPAERFNKSCYICEEHNKESAKSHGACMNCHKPGCKLSFHVTCAQSKRQLCEEASINGHVQYVGYCTNHWQKRLKLKYQTNNDGVSKKCQKERKNSRIRTESTSSTNSIDLNPSRMKKARNSVLFESETSQDEILEPSFPVINTQDKLSEDEKSILSPPRNIEKSFSTESTASPVIIESEILSNGIHVEKNEIDTLSPPIKSPTTISTIKHHKRLKSFDNSDDDDKVDNLIKKPIESPIEKKLFKAKKPKVEKQEKIKDKAVSSEKTKKRTVPKKETVKKKKEKFAICKKNQKVSSPPQQVNINQDVSYHNQDLKETPGDFQSFLEYQWNQSSQFITSTAKHYDVASLLGCLHQLKSDNSKLEKRLSNLQARKERLLGLNARLEAFPSSKKGAESSSNSSLSDMLSKLNETRVNLSSSLSPTVKKELNKDETNEIIKPNKKQKKNIDQAHSKTSKNTELLLSSSSDLAMLAAASVSHARPPITPDEKPADFLSIPGRSMLIQPNIDFASHSRTSSSSQASTNKLLTDLLSQKNCNMNHEEKP